MDPWIYCIGEVVFDIIFKNGQPVTANPGGSMLNTAVSLGRTGSRVSFIGECGKDHAGDLISQFLENNSVYIGYMTKGKSAQTTIALAFLNKKNDADYAFYKSPETNSLNTLPDISKGDFLLFGSYYAISSSTGEIVYQLAKKASEKDAVLFYDPNFRKPHLSQLPELKIKIERNMRLADIVRGSDEDFQLIFGIDNAEKIWALDCFMGKKVLIYTKGGQEVHLFTREYQQIYQVPEIKTLSTIGAGDSFNAGVIKSLADNGFNKKTKVNSTDWDKAISQGIRFAQEVCRSYENFVPENFR